jgi:putative ABC transport system substrate-binding protein
MTKNIASIALGALLLALGYSVDAQQPVKVPRIGYLADGGTSAPQALVQALRSLGYVEGENIAFDYRTTKDNSERKLDGATELAQLKVNIMVADGSGPSLAAKKATSTIPIVMITSTDPVANGIFTSLNRPGGNVTGLIRVNAESGKNHAALFMMSELLVTGQRLGLLKEINPQISRVGILRDAASASAISSKWYELVSGPQKLEIQYLDVKAPSPNFTATFEAAVKAHVDALIVLGTPMLNSYREQIAALAAKNGLALMAEGNDAVEAGSLISYGWSDADVFRRVARYVDKILQGVKPADLPVETWPCIDLSATTKEHRDKEGYPYNCQEPTKPELVVNLKTAKQIGVTIPPEVLARANRVIR